MATYFATTFTVAYTLWLFYFTSLTCSGTSGEPAEKCDIKMWYLNKIGEGLFPQDLSEEQKTLKNTIETLIQKSSTEAHLSNVDCSVLKTYESVFSASTQNETSDASQDGDEPASESDKGDDEHTDDESDETDETEDDSELEFDETEMTDVDETESEEGDKSEDNGEEPQDGDKKDDKIEEFTSEENIVEKDNSDTATLSINSFNTCNRKKNNQTCNFCVFYNVATVQCSLSEGPDRYTATTSTGSEESNGSSQESDVPQDATNKPAKTRKSSDKTQESPKRAKETLKSDKTNKQDKHKERAGSETETKNDVDNRHDDPTTSSSSQDKETESNSDLPLESDDASQDNKQNTQSKAADFDMNQFKMLLEKTAGEYLIKVQTLETQIMRLENELLTEKLNKQNHSSSFTRLENQILKLENELLKMNLSYEELKEENEKIIKKQKSFLELDYVKRPGERLGLPDNSTKQYELISQHQNKISELTSHLRNQSKLIDKIRGQSENLEDQNRMLFQIVMNQTMLISQIMKKVETLTNSNLKHHIQQQLLSDKLGIALTSAHAMDDLHALVSDQLISTRKDDKKAGQVLPLSSRKLKEIPSLSMCKHPKRCKEGCGFNSLVLFQCLWNDDPITQTSKTKETTKPSKVVSGKVGEKDQQTVEPIIKPSTEDMKESKKQSANKVSTDKESKGTPKKVKEKDSEKAEQKLKSATEDKKESKKHSASKDSKNIESKDTHKKTTDESKPSKKKVENKKVAAEKKSAKVTGKESEKEKKKQENDKKLTEKPSTKEQKTNKLTPGKNLTKSEKSENEIKNQKDGEKANGNIEKSKTVPKQKKVVKSDKANGKKVKKPKSESQPTKVDRIPPLYNVTKQSEAKDCYDYYRRGKPKDGQYKIKLYGTDSTMPVFCDMKNGGWTVIQRRQDGTVNFFKDWKEYKKGFGGLYGEHWLGNDNIHRLTNQGQYEMRVDLMDWNKNKKYALYEYVRVDDEAEGYKLHVEGYSGDAGDGFSKHNGEKFSTKDKDNDRVVKEFGGSCANRFKGAWWYYKCYASNLNGKFYKGGVIPEKQFDGITWKPWTGPNISLKKVEIKIRPIVKK